MESNAENQKLEVGEGFVLVISVSQFLGMLELKGTALGKHLVGSPYVSR